MEHPKKLIETLTFVNKEHKKHQPKGVSSSIDISRAILSLESSVKAIATNGLDKFHMQERGLYQPLKEHLDTLLPVPTMVDIESVLKKLSNPQQRTDISIRKLFEIEEPRLGDFYSECFIEIKSVFFGERISDSDISDDLDKLLECREKYKAKVFFVLVGLKSEINKSSYSLLGNPGVDRTAFNVTTNSNKTAWLMPSGANKQGKLNIFVWAVSSENKFPKGFKTCKYSIFQEA